MAALRWRLSPTRAIMRRSFRYGRRGRRAWMAVYLAFLGATAFKRAATRQQQFVSVDMLRPGERVTIRTIPVQSAKERKRLLRGQN
jgi:hypothetical protein